MSAGKGSQAPGSAAEVTRIPEQPELHLASKPYHKPPPSREDVAQTSSSPASAAEHGVSLFLPGFPAIPTQKLLAR